jgi:hypothetical protein
MSKRNHSSFNAVMDGLRVTSRATAPSKAASPAKAVPAQLEVTPPVEVVEKKDKGPTVPKRVNVDWKDEDVKIYLVDKVEEKKAYMSIPGENIEKKFDEIADELWEIPLFQKYTKVKGNSIQQAWLRIREYVSSRHSIEKEGANLSAIPNEIPTWELKVVALIEEQLNLELEKTNKKAKEVRRENSMLAFEKDVIHRHNEAIEDDDYEIDGFGDDMDGGEFPSSLQKKRRGDSVSKVTTATKGNTEMGAFESTLVDLAKQQMGSNKVMKTPEEVALEVREREMEMQRKQWDMEKEKKREEREHEREERQGKKDEMMMSLLSAMLKKFSD